MDRRILGIGFLGIAALLQVSRYLVVSIINSGTRIHTPIFELSYNELGGGLTSLAIFCMIVGLVYLIVGEVVCIKKEFPKKEKISNI